jgi:hypothetical protein
MTYRVDGAMHAMEAACGDSASDTARRETVLPQLKQGNHPMLMSRQFRELAFARAMVTFRPGFRRNVTGAPHAARIASFSQRINAAASQDPREIIPEAPTHLRERPWRRPILARP